MCKDWTDYPDDPSWVLAHDALAFDSDQGWCKQLEILELALANAGPVTEATVVDEDTDLVIARVEWRTGPWLAVQRHGGIDSETFLFRTEDAAREWVRLRAEEAAGEPDFL